MILLVGASASGKTVTALDLQKRYGLVKAVTTTTREKRVGETDGIEYFFISKEEFKKRLKEGKFVEHSLYNDNYYGCGVDQVDDNKIVVLDPNGLHSFLKLNNKHVVSFLLIADEKTRHERMVSRGDKQENITKRLENDVNDFSLDKIGKVDYVIHTENKTIEQTSDEIYKLYKEKISN
ncbi:MAG: hypothetical protein MJ222_03105 [Bacilli bacterium]|nr:hypothetical protein [Bacilli bacterium]